MSTTAKIIYILLAVFAIGLGVEGFLYFQAINKVKTNYLPTPTPKATNPPSPSQPVDIKTGSLLIGSLDLIKINKTDVLNWTKSGGIISINTNKIVAGYFKELSSNGITLVQESGDTSNNLDSSIRLWTKTDSYKLSYSGPSSFLVISDTLKNLIGVGDLVLLINNPQNQGQFSASDVVVFK